MKDNSKLLAIIVSILAIIVVIISLVNGKEKTKEKKEEETKIKIVTNYSNFYTVNSCLYRTITYLSTEDKESLFLVLDERYKKENNITKENVLDVFEKVEDNSTFDSKKMYYQELNNDITKYYVYGSILKNQLFDGDILIEPEEKDVYFIIYIDSSKKIFSVEPYDGKIFIEGDINEK